MEPWGNSWEPPGNSLELQAGELGTEPRARGGTREPGREPGTQLNWYLAGTARTPAGLSIFFTKIPI